MSPFAQDESELNQIRRPSIPRTRISRLQRLLWSRYFNHSTSRSPNKLLSLSFPTPIRINSFAWREMFGVKKRQLPRVDQDFDAEACPGQVRNVLHEEGYGHEYLGCGGNLIRGCWTMGGGNWDISSLLASGWVTCWGIVWTGSSWTRILSPGDEIMAVPSSAESFCPVEPGTSVSERGVAVLGSPRRAVFVHA